MLSSGSDPGPGSASVRAPLDDAVLAARLLAPAGPLARLEVLAKVGSTNSELLRRVDDARPGGDWEAPALVVANHQEAGRGRLDRAWQTPEGTALTSSLLLRPRTPRATWSWLPLLAGLATVRAVRRLTGVAAGLKWPNDVLAPTVDGTDILGWGQFRKLGGILTEVVATGDGVVVGVGLNVDQRDEELPVASAISLRLAGAEPVSREDLLVGCVTEFCEVTALWCGSNGDADASGLRHEVADILVTVGHEIRAYVPGGREVRGLATGLTADGGLIVDVPGTGEDIVLSGDVHHVRLGDGA